MERKFYEKYTSLKVPLARFFLAPFLSSRSQRIDAANTFFFPVGSIAASQKRKLLDEGLERKREKELNELYDGKARPLNLGWIVGGRVLGDTVFFSLHFDFDFLF